MERERTARRTTSRRRGTSSLTPAGRRQQRAGQLLLLGLGSAVAGLLWALAHHRRLTLVSDVLLGIGTVSVVAGAVVGLSALSLGSSRRRRRARRLARARSTTSGPDH